METLPCLFLLCRDQHSTDVVLISLQVMHYRRRGYRLKSKVGKEPRRLVLVALLQFWTSSRAAFGRCKGYRNLDGIKRTLHQHMAGRL